MLYNIIGLGGEYISVNLIYGIAVASNLSEIPRYVCFIFLFSVCHISLSIEVNQKALANQGYTLRELVIVWDQSYHWPHDVSIQRKEDTRTLYV